MVLTGRQKAALLLTNLDVLTASELLKDVKPEVVEELAVELTYLDTAGFCNSNQSASIAREFYSTLNRTNAFDIKNFLNEMLKKTVGDEKAKQIQAQIQNLVQKRAPFMSIRSADSEMLAQVLENEHPQAIAVVLSELPTQKSSEVLSLLSENVRFSAISRMTYSKNITAEARKRIAETICKHLETISSGIGGNPKESLRKVAVILRNLGKELRDGLLGVIAEKDSVISKKVSNLMIVWNDIPQIGDNSLQEALRVIDTKKLATALFEADETVVDKIRSNISERAAATIDEETSLMPIPKKNDIERARKDILKPLRQMNKNGELSFIEE